MASKNSHWRNSTNLSHVFMGDRVWRSWQNKWTGLANYMIPGQKGGPCMYGQDFSIKRPQGMGVPCKTSQELTGRSSIKENLPLQRGAITYESIHLPTPHFSHVACTFIFAYYPIFLVWFMFVLKCWFSPCTFTPHFFEINFLHHSWFVLSNLFN